jgi:hypothetical protein
VIDTSDPDWWFGENQHGQQGLFPKTYVQLESAPSCKEYGHASQEHSAGSSGARFGACAEGATGQTPSFKARQSHKLGFANVLAGIAGSKAPNPQEQQQNRTPIVVDSNLLVAAPQPPVSPAHNFKMAPSNPPPLLSPGSNRMSAPKPPLRTWKINKERYALCYKFFLKLAEDSLNGQKLVKGEKAADFLLKSGLDKPSVARILSLSDMDQDRMLDRDEWVVAHHLTICIAKEDMPLPSKLPEYLVPKGKRSLIK